VGAPPLAHFAQPKVFQTLYDALLKNSAADSTLLSVAWFILWGALWRNSISE
jgi:hypothetical protein